MRKKLDSEVENQLLARVFISRRIGVFTLKDIADGFGISERTVYRYADPEDRQLSRVAALSCYYATRDERMAATKHCHSCGESIATHHRCAACEILLHTPRAYCSQRCFDSPR